MDRRRAMDVLMELKNQAKALTATERQLVDQLEDIRTTLTRINDQVINLTNSVAPVSSLPIEILTEIFNVGRYTDRSIHRKYDHSYPMNPEEVEHGMPFIVLASHICRHWRNVAITSPALWTGVRFSLTQSPNLLGLFLQRSGERVLNIEMQGCAPSTHSLNVMTNDIVAAADCWRRFSFASSSCVQTDRMISQIQDIAAPRLEFFFIDLVGIRSRHDDRSPFRVLTGGAPCLKTIDFMGIGLLSCWPPLHTVNTMVLLPMGEVQVSPMSSLQFRDMLTESRSLTTLTLLGEVVQLEPLYEDIPPTELPSLRSLDVALERVEETDPDPTCALFTNVAMPGLSSLSFVDHANEAQILYFMDFIRTQRTSSPYPDLSHITFSDADGLPNCIDTAFILALPTITFLTLIRSGEDCVLKLLTDPAQDPPLWPELESLEITCFDITCLRAFVSFRIRRGLPICALYIPEEGGDSGITECDLDWLKERVPVLEHTAH